MSRKLPSPIALRAFECAARHLSFTQAAEELSVTQSAVSHQVRALEEDLGVRLFLRLTRQLRLTEAGEQLLLVLRNSFDRIEEAVENVRIGRPGGTLNIGLTSYFAARWMTRRIGRFSVRHPDIELRLHLANEPVSFDRMDLDVAVAWGLGDWTGLVATPLMATQIIAVCSTDLTADRTAVMQLADLANYPILHENDYGLWNKWLDAIGENSIRLGTGVIMSDPNVVHQAAIEGQGIALGAEELLADKIPGDG